MCFAGSAGGEGRNCLERWADSEGRWAARGTAVGLPDVVVQAQTAVLGPQGRAVRARVELWVDLAGGGQARGRVSSGGQAGWSGRVSSGGQAGWSGRVSSGGQAGVVGPG
ncbi:hypothetical protein L3i22_091200 [Actinoplanes sp. L3-i22]|nr:hypothetical protein L3i22_091200 [Actinoplanes sp. L3-i22]